MYDLGAGTIPASGGVVGQIRVLRHIRSPALANARDVLVYLPPSYRTSGRHYPVIYMHDGQNLFDAATSFAGEWQVDETMERIGPLGYEAIVVGIPNMGSERCDEYSPWVDRRGGGGRGDAYVAFIVETLKPTIDRRFRTRREREFTGVMGSSMGALISLYAFFARPTVFGFTGAMSPALWFADAAMESYVRTVDRWFGRVYLDIGTAEGRQHVAACRRLQRLLRARCPFPRDQIRLVVEDGAGHNEAAWAARFETAVRFLLPKRRLDVNW